MMRHYAILLSGILLIMMQACSSTDSDELLNEGDYIKYGTSFGMCLGYCIHDIKITSDEIRFSKNGHDIDNLLPEVTLSTPIEMRYWQTLTAQVNFDEFNQLDSVIGCPDCADGGAEWIEIRHNGQVHKVIFEYMNEPETVSPYISYLRTYMNTFEIEENEALDFNVRTLINQNGIVRNSTCPDACNKYVIGIANNADTSYFYDQYLHDDFKMDYLVIEFNGVLKYDSTTISQQNTDVETEVFKARNMRTFGINSTLD
jgi:hypothetical protein